MNSMRKPGHLDPDYGREGIAPVPAKGLSPDTHTLQVFPADAQPGFGTAFYGLNPNDPDQSHGLFTRLNEDGSWDAATGHVPVTPLPTPIPEWNYGYTTMLHAPLDGKPRFLTTAQIPYINDNNEVSVHLAIGSYDQAFQPTVGFGENGISLPPPYWPDQPRRLLPSPLARQAPKALEPRAVTYRGTQVGLSGDKVKAIFEGDFFGWDHETSFTWCLQFDPATGEPASGLGVDGTQSLWALPLRNGQRLSPIRASFLNDGGFLLLARAGNSAFLQRFNANATLDPSFADGVGYVELPIRSGLFGMAVQDDQVVISSPARISLSGPSPTFLHGFTLGGQPVAEFTFELGPPDQEGSMILDHAQFDPQGRLVLTGQRVFKISLDPQLQSEARVARLLKNGELDASFGEAGFTPAHSLLWAVNDLYVSAANIDVLAVHPVSQSSSFYEVMARYQA